MDLCVNDVYILLGLHCINPVLNCYFTVEGCKISEVIEIVFYFSSQKSYLNDGGKYKSER